MITFLPYSNLKDTAKCLDDKRLGKQRVEVLSLLVSDKWNYHPCAKMWKGYHYSLCEYGIVICEEWIKRGFIDTCLNKIIEIQTKPWFSKVVPKWFNDKRLHLSHRSNLLRKDPVWYSQFSDVPNDLPYWWPE